MLTAPYTKRGVHPLQINSLAHRTQFKNTNVAYIYWVDQAKPCGSQSKIQADRSHEHTILWILMFSHKMYNDKRKSNKCHPAFNVDSGARQAKWPLHKKFFQRWIKATHGSSLVSSRAFTDNANVWIEARWTLFMTIAQPLDWCEGAAPTAGRQPTLSRTSVPPVERNVVALNTNWSPSLSLLIFPIADHDAFTLAPFVARPHDLRSTRGHCPLVPFFL